MKNCRKLPPAGVSGFTLSRIARRWHCAPAKLAALSNDKPVSRAKPLNYQCTAHLVFAPRAERNSRVPSASRFAPREGLRRHSAAILTKFLPVMLSAPASDFAAADRRYTRGPLTYRPTGIARGCPSADIRVLLQRREPPVIMVTS